MKPLALLLCLIHPALAAGADGDVEWLPWSPRVEARPEFAMEIIDGPPADAILTLQTGPGEHWIGAMTKVVPITGGQHYRFHAQVKHSPMPTPRRSVYARILWQDAAGKPVTWEEPAKQGYAKGTTPRAEPEYPRMPRSEPNQWTPCDSTLRAPSAAKQAKIELYLQWAANARVDWKEVTFTATAAPAPRKVKLATVHLQPKEGKNPTDKTAAVRPAHRRGGTAEGRSRRPARNAHLLRHRQEDGGVCGGHPRPQHRVLRRTRQETRPLHRRRSDRA